MKIVITFYHGTTIENAKKLVQSNWDWTSKHMQNWNVSMPGKVYAWCGPVVSYINCEEPIFSELQQDNWRAIEYALESAQVAGAIQNTRHEDLVVLGYFEEIEIDKTPDEYSEITNLIEDNLQWFSDDSCENMQGAFETSISNLQNKVPNVIYIGKKTYSPMLRGVLIPLDNDLCLLPELTPMEEKIINIMRKDEDLSYFLMQLIENSELVEIKDIGEYLKRLEA